MPTPVRNAEAGTPNPSSAEPMQASSKPPRLKQPWNDDIRARASRASSRLACVFVGTSVIPRTRPNAAVAATSHGKVGAQPGRASAKAATTEAVRVRRRLPSRIASAPATAQAESDNPSSRLSDGNCVTQTPDTTPSARNTAAIASHTAPHRRIQIGCAASS